MNAGPNSIPEHGVFESRNERDENEKPGNVDGGTALWVLFSFQVVSNREGSPEEGQLQRPRLSGKDLKEKRISCRLLGDQRRRRVVPLP